MGFANRWETYDLDWKSCIIDRESQVFVPLGIDILPHHASLQFLNQEKKRGVRFKQTWGEMNQKLWILHAVYGWSSGVGYHQWKNFGCLLFLGGFPKSRFPCIQGQGSIYGVFWDLWKIFFFLSANRMKPATKTSDWESNTRNKRDRCEIYRGGWGWGWNWGWSDTNDKFIMTWMLNLFPKGKRRIQVKK